MIVQEFCGFFGLVRANALVTLAKCLGAAILSPQVIGQSLHVFVIWPVHKCNSPLRHTCLNGGFSIQMIMWSLAQLKFWKLSQMCASSQI